MVSVHSLSLCGNMRQPPSLSLWDRTLCVLRCAQGRLTGFPLVAITTGLFVFLLYAQYNNIRRLWGQAGASRLKKTQNHNLQEQQGTAFRSRQVLSRSRAQRTQASHGCAGVSVNIITKSGQKEAFWFALACEQTGLLGHRCKCGDVGLKVRIKWRTLMFYKFCETCQTLLQAEGLPAVCLPKEGQGRH